MPISSALLLLCLGPWPQGQPAGPATVNAAQEGAVRRLMESLPAKSEWRDMLKQGARGDGIRQPWMDEMRNEGVKLAVFTFEFQWIRGGAGLKNLKSWTLASAEYFNDYDYQTSQPITDTLSLASIEACGLQSRLEAVALARAKRGIWIEDPGHQHPPRKTGTGFKQVLLAESEWLPVQMFPWFGEYEAGTTPLMHAALLGQVRRLDKLLGQGADVNAVTPHGTTALVYASEAGNPAALQTLLAAGADPNRTTKDGSTALMTAAAGGDVESVVLLLKAGANPTSRDAQGNSALSIATQRQHREVAMLLKQAGARE